MTTVESSVNTRVAELLQQQIADGQQIGVQVCAYLDGKPVVDTWAGNMGPRDDRPVAADSLFSSFSTTKGVASTLLHILADRGLIEYEAPVAKYWPAFGAHGKDRITVMQAISHMAGVHTTPVPDTNEYIVDW